MLIIPPEIFSQVDWRRLYSIFTSAKLRTVIIVLVLPQLVGHPPILPRSNIYCQMIDGPPLRALVLIKYAEWLLLPEQHNGTWVADVLWPAVNLDLQWISQHWNESSYVSHILYVTILSSNSTFIVDGISGGLPCGEVRTGRPLCNIARYERELAFVV
jgi:hypothetical protein